MRKKVAYLGVFLALALVFSYVESLIPPLFAVPGIKLGLANIVIIIVLYTMGAKEAYAVSVARVLLAGFLFGNGSAILYGMAGALLSLTVMVLLKRTDKFKIVTVSAVGGISHNVGQLIIAILVVSNYNLALYMPILLVVGLATGLVIGIVGQEICLRIRRFVPAEWQQSGKQQDQEKEENRQR